MPTDPEQGWRWWVYLAGRCWANLPHALANPAPVVDALINLERDVRWPAEIRGAGRTSLTLAERLFLRWLCQRNPAWQSAFEFGTGTGQTARLLADCGLKVWTLDLPRGPDRSGQQAPCCYPGITCLAGDSRNFDFSPYIGSMDLVFVDGGHDAETVLNDTISAYQLRRPGGVIIWHDCNVQHRDVWRLLLALRQGRPLVRVEGTRLALDGPWERP